MYLARECEAENESEKEAFKVTASAEVLLEKEKPSMDKESLLELGMYRQKENVGDVRLETELNDNQNKYTRCNFVRNLWQTFFACREKRQRLSTKLNW